MPLRTSPTHGTTLIRALLSASPSPPSTYACRPQCGRCELVVGRRSTTILRSRGFFGVHAQRDVAACQQVVQGLQSVTRDLLLVVEGQVTLTYTPQGATAVIVVGQGDHPGVLVHEEVTLGVDVALTLLDVALYFPGAVQLEAGVFRVDVTGFQHVGVLQARLGQLTGVVGQEDFLLADQFPIVTVRSTVVHGEVVGGAHTVGGGTRTVIGDLRSTAYTTLTGVVYPGHARFLQLVEGIVYQQHVTRQSGRGVHPLFEEQQGVGHARRIDVGHQVRITDFLFHLDQSVGTVGLRHGLHVPAMHVQTIAGHVVPDHLGPALRNREDEGGTRLDVLHAVATVYQSGLASGALDLVIDRLREGHCPAALVHRHAEGFRIAFEQSDLAGGQVVAILLVVLGSNHELRLIVLERVFQEVVGQALAGIGRQTAGPLGDGTRGVTGLLRADRRQGGAQLIDLGLGQALRRNGTGQQAQRQTAGTYKDFLHLHTVILQNLIRSLRRS